MARGKEKLYPCPRDTKRQRVYDAQFRGHRVYGRVFSSSAEAQEYCDRLCKRLDVAPVQVVWSAKRSDECWADAEIRRIYIESHRRSYRTEKMLLHELAHICQPPLTAMHGPEFLKVWLDLVELKMGKREAKALRAALIKEGALPQP